MIKTLKKLLPFPVLVLALLLTMLITPPPAQAGVGAKIDAALTKYWKEGKAEKNIHILDNVTSAYFYDINNGTKMAGVVSSFYTFKHFSADLGVIKSIEEDTSGYPLLGVNYKIGDHLAGYEWAQKIAAPVVKYAPLLKSLTVGVWGGRDYNAALYRYGLYGGLAYKF